MYPSRPRRFDCAYPVVVRLRDGVVEAVIENANYKGARLRGIQGARVGDVCSLVIDGDRVFANIVWAKGDAGGVCFHAALNPRQLAAVLRPVIGVAAVARSEVNA